MATRLFADYSDSRCEEILAGVPPGTATRLATCEASACTTTLYSSDQDILTLSRFRHCGFGTLTTQVRDFLLTRGVSQREGEETDPEAVALILQFQGVALAPAAKALITKVYWF